MEPFEVYVVITSIVSMVLLLFAWIRMKVRFQKNPFLKLGIISAVSFNILYFLIGMLYLFEIDTSYLIERLALIIICLIFFFGYLFYEGFLSVKPPLWRLLLMFSFLAFSIGLIIITLVGRDDGRSLLFYTFLNGSAFSIFGIRVTRKTMKITKHPGLKVDILALFFLLIGTFIAEIIGLLRYYMNYTFENQIIQTLFIAASGLIMVSLITLGINSWFHGDYIHLMPVKIYTILIYNKGGLLVYNREIRNQGENITRHRDEILSGALMAFSSFFKEFLGAGAELIHIDAREYEFLFSPLPKELGTCVFIVSKANYYLKRFLNILSTNIPTEFLNDINDKGGFHRHDDIIDKHIKDSIPYIDF